VGSRGTFDVALDNINTILEAYSDEEAAIDTTLAYSVLPDVYRSPNPNPGAYIYDYLGPLSPKPGQSGVYKHYELDVQYWLDLIVESQGAKSGATYTRADAIAGLRLRYLMQQVMTALLRPESADLGFEPGTLAGPPELRIEPLPPEMQTGDKPVIGARTILTLHMAWEPTLLTGTPMDSIDVDAGRFTALYEPGG
jgi:hypothetical protein